MLNESQQAELQERMFNWFETCRYCKSRDVTKLPDQIEKGKVYHVIECNSCHAKSSYTEDTKKDVETKIIKDL